MAPAVLGGSVTAPVEDIVIFGNGGMASVVSACIERHGTHRIVGYTVDRAYAGDGSFRGRPLVPWEEIERHHPPGSVALLGPVTFRHLNAVRRDRYREAKERGYRFARFLHPRAEIMSEAIGENVMILALTVIEPHAAIGDNVMIWSQSHVGHHTVVGPHTYVSSQVTIAGSTRIGAECHIGAKAAVGDRIAVGDRVAMLHGAHTYRDVPEGSVLCGPLGEVRRVSSERIRHLL